MQDYQLLLYILSTSKERNIVYLLNRLKNLRKMLNAWYTSFNCFDTGFLYPFLPLYKKAKEKKRNLSWWPFDWQFFWFKISVK